MCKVIDTSNEIYISKNHELFDLEKEKRSLLTKIKELTNTSFSKEHANTSQNTHSISYHSHLHRYANSNAQPIKKLFVCTYCMKKGHISTYCRVKDNLSSLKLFWVPKGTKSTNPFVGNKT